MSITLQPAFVLHRRAYRETSLIVEFYTRDYGRIAACARGIRKAGSRNAALLQPFMPLVVSFYGKGELLTLSQVEASGFLRILSGKNLRCGFYLNELLMRLLPKHDPHVELFAIYRQTLEDLQRAASSPRADWLCEKALRLFEKRLLMEIGYGLPSGKEGERQLFHEEDYYRFDTEQGFSRCAQSELKTPRRPGVCSGKTLNALLTENFEDSQSLQEVKRLMRFILASLLGRPLESRRLFECYAGVDENV
jgi:DNA repair protein RecO (recombination protein O)